MCTFFRLSQDNKQAGVPFYLMPASYREDVHLVHTISQLGVGMFLPGCAWYLWAPGAGPRQKGENHAEAWPPASTRRTLGRYPFHTMRRWPTQDRWIHSPGDKETVTIHFPRRSTHRVTWKPCGHGDHSFHPR